MLENALHVALKGGRTEFVQLLLDSADVSLKSYLTINRLRELHQENVSKYTFYWATPSSTCSEMPITKALTENTLIVY